MCFISLRRLPDHAGGAPAHRLMLRALLWDVDGTLAETERDGHLVAFNQAFEALGVPWRWSEARYAELLAVAGGRERLLHDMQRQARSPRRADRRRALAERIHRLKNERYAAIIGGGAVALRPGVAQLFDDCERAAVRMAIVTTTSRANVTALLEARIGPDWRRRFAAVVCAEDAPRKKPEPQVYLRALAQLAVPAHAALAIEDAPAGVLAARGAHVAVVVSRSVYFASADLPGALAVGPSLGCTQGWRPAVERPHASRIDLQQLSLWHAGQ